MRQYRRLFILIMVMLLTALACNLPRAVPEMYPPPGAPTSEAENKIPFIFPTPTPPVSVPTNSEPGFAGAPAPSVLPIFPPPILDGSSDYFLYTIQSGDTLPALARRFGVEPWEVLAPFELHPEYFLPLGQSMYIPNQIGIPYYPIPIMPDSEVIYSPSTVGFNIHLYIQEAGGFLSFYHERLDGELVSGAEIVRLVADETSINPRLLLAFLEHRSNWVTGYPAGAENTTHPIGFYVSGSSGLYKELSLVAQQLTTGYYGWRSGTVSMLVFPDRTSERIGPGLNAGTVAVQYLFSKFYKQDAWIENLYGDQNFISLHRSLFGDPIARAISVEPLFHPGLGQPPLELPFLPDQRWSFTGGPHRSWFTGTPWGALDFAPVTGEARCAISRVYVTASAPGLVVRSERNAVVLDLDGDGYEQTGWNLFYYHISKQDRIEAGVHVPLDAPLGRPSCEGGVTTGTHLHIARKYNGEWIAADGPLPFVLSGWKAYAGEKPYEGFLFKGELIVTARPDGSLTSSITR
jgi:LasA protease